VVAYDERILSAELETDFREDRPRAHALLDRLSRGHRAGEAHQTDARIVDERRTDLRSESLDNRIDSARQACFLQQLAKRDGGLRRELVRFRDDRVAAHE